MCDALLKYKYECDIVKTNFTSVIQTHLSRVMCFQPLFCVMYFTYKHHKFKYGGV